MTGVTGVPLARCTPDVTFEGGAVPNLVDLFHQVSLFAILTMAVSVSAFGLAVSYAIRPTERKLVLMRPVSLAAIFATLGAVPGGWAMVLGGLAIDADRPILAGTPIGLLQEGHVNVMRECGQLPPGKFLSQGRYPMKFR